MTATTPTTGAETVLASSGTFTEHAPQLRAAVFGRLVRIAAPVITNYHGDLFHDAEWLIANLNGPSIFWFVARDYGTHIGTDRDLLRYVTTYAAAPLYRVSLTHEQARRWVVTIEKEEAEKS